MCAGGGAGWQWGGGDGCGWGLNPVSKVTALKFGVASQACTARVRGQTRLVHSWSVSLLEARLSAGTLAPLLFGRVHYFGVNNLKRS